MQCPTETAKISGASGLSMFFSGWALPEMSCIRKVEVSSGFKAWKMVSRTALGLICIARAGVQNHVCVYACVSTNQSACLPACLPGRESHRTQ